jgi:ureidoglycolate dehydrogenase (NAD+)
MTKAISVSQLNQFCMDSLLDCGLNKTTSKMVSEVLITTDTFGVFSHGIKSLIHYVKKLKNGGINPKAFPSIISEGPAWAIINGHNSMGMISSIFAMNIAINKAKYSGIAYVGVQNCNHFGAAGYYANMATKYDMLGLAMSNSCPTMAIPGGYKSILGTNPFAYSIPTNNDPIFLDIASSVIAGGKLCEYDKVPEGWLIDSEGNPSSDPSIYPSRGCLLPFAGHKGYGLAIMIETLSSVLSNALMMSEVQNWIDADTKQSTNNGSAFLAFNIGAMIPINKFKNRIDQMSKEIHETPRIKGCKKIYLPGEKEWENRKEALKNGIIFPKHVINNIKELSNLLNIKPNWI